MLLNRRMTIGIPRDASDVIWMKVDRTRGTKEYGDRTQSEGYGKEKG